MDVPTPEQAACVPDRKLDIRSASRVTAMLEYCLENGLKIVISDLGHDFRSTYHRPCDTPQHFLYLNCTSAVL